MQKSSLSRSRKYFSLLLRIHVLPSPSRSGRHISATPRASETKATRAERTRSAPLLTLSRTCREGWKERKRDPSWRYSILVRMSKCRSSYLGFRPYVSSSTTGTGCLRNFGIFSTVLGIRNHPIILTSMRIYFENLYRMIEFKIEMKWRGKG